MTHSPSLFKLTLGVSTLLSCLVSSQNVRVRSLSFDHTEHTLPGESIGDLSEEVTRSNISSTAPTDLTFNMVQKSAHSSLFSVDHQGQLTNKYMIDRETLCASLELCTVQFDVICRSRDFLILFKIQIMIIDVNDRVPIFPQEFFEVSLPESTTEGASVRLPSADDLDSPKYGVQRYELLDNSGVFKLDVAKTDDGDLLQLVLAAPLDRESQASYDLSLKAFDGGLPSQSGSLNITVIISDINDNKPLFGNDSYSVYIPEDTNVGTTLINVSAFDPDEGHNGKVVYTLSSTSISRHGHLFSVDRHSGALKLQQTLDFESQQEYKLTLMAQDMGPNSLPTYTTVFVHVLDVNDNPPIITHYTVGKSGIAEVFENSPVGTFVTYSTIYDPDGGSGGVVNCTCSGDVFSLRHMHESEYQLVTMRVLDREEQEYYKVNITCSDQGSPAMVSSSPMLVQVKDTNDNGPLFSDPVYQIYLEENTIAGTSVYRVHAIDLDSSKNGNVSYSLVGENSELLTVGSTSGIIYTNAVLDHETKSQYELIVLATDQGMPQRTGTAKIKIQTLNVNDEAPLFVKDAYTFKVYENMGAGTEVGRVRAVDRDIKPYNQHLYRIRDDVLIRSRFKIDSQRGVISLLSPLDREYRAQYKLLVIAEDVLSDSLSGSVIVTVNVADTNDNAPKFVFPSKPGDIASISNPDGIGQQVCRVTTSDRDVGVNARVSYFIKSGNDMNLFAIDKHRGYVTVDSDLPKTTQDYVLRIVARDNGVPALSSETTLHVHVNMSVTSRHMEQTYPMLPIICVAIAAGVTILVLGLILISLKFDLLRDVNFRCPKFRWQSQRAVREQSLKFDNIRSTIDRPDTSLMNKWPSPQRSEDAHASISSEADSGRGLSDGECWPHEQQTNYNKTLRSCRLNYSQGSPEQYEDQICHLYYRPPSVTFDPNIQVAYGQAPLMSSHVTPFHMYSTCESSNERTCCETGVCRLADIKQCCTTQCEQSCLTDQTAEYASIDQCPRHLDNSSPKVTLEGYTVPQYRPPVPPRRPPFAPPVNIGTEEFPHYVYRQKEEGSPTLHTGSRDSDLNHDDGSSTDTD